MLISWFAGVRGQAALQRQIAALLQMTGAYSISGAAALRSVDCIVVWSLQA